MVTEVNVETLTQIVASVFESMMNLNVSLSERSWDCAPDHLTSFVQLTGEWEGAVLFECSQSQACQFAGRILSMEPPAKVDDDVRDMLGELANMIGGNLKSEMATGVHLSMPTVMDGSDYGLHLCGSKVHKRLALHCAMGHFWVTVLTTEAGATRSGRPVSSQYALLPN